MGVGGLASGGRWWLLVALAAFAGALPNNLYGETLRYGAHSTGSWAPPTSVQEETTAPGAEPTGAIPGDGTDDGGLFDMSTP